MKKKGVALVLAISIIFILLFVGIILVLLARRETGLTVSLKNRNEAFDYAEAGINQALYAFQAFGSHGAFAEPDGYRIDFEKGWFTREGYHVIVTWIGQRPPSGYQQGPQFLAHGSFQGFYYHVRAEGFKGNIRRVVHLTVERVYPVEK
ncbi:MAG: pilus assembly PilX N-terminal domain-containing protein [bacterium]